MISRSRRRDQPLGLLGEDLHQLAEADLPERGILGGRQEARRADRARHEATFSRRPPRDLGATMLISRVCSVQAPLASFRREAWKVSVSDDFRARLEHRAVDPLDHVGAVQDERLVAAFRLRPP